MTKKPAHRSAAQVKSGKAASIPKIVCLCGSTRFQQDFVDANAAETMCGNIVLSVGFFGHASDDGRFPAIPITDAQKVRLDELHKRKIDLADEILVINKNGYVGKSTQSEIQYAMMQGKPIRFWYMNMPMQFDSPC